MSDRERTIPLDVVVFGGGCAGLWLLDELVRCGYRALLIESQALGAGQTIASQGIIHGGLKYTLKGLLTRSAQVIATMPEQWRQCLAGQREPCLTETPLRADFCHLWRTGSITSRLGMVGARAGLRVAPKQIEGDEVPPILRRCPGGVYRLDEQVIDPRGFIADLARRNAAHLVHCTEPVEWRMEGRWIEGIGLMVGGGQVVLKPRAVVFAAGAGNAALRRAVGLSDAVMQRRPLHMAVVRGRLPVLNGHCVDGQATRMTITTATTDDPAVNVWQLGGQVAERGVEMDRHTLIAHAAEELRDVLPGIDLDGLEWSTYRVDRAEAATTGGRRPDDASVLADGFVITAWPTKLALTPWMATLVLGHLSALKPQTYDQPLPTDWPTPPVASPPWELESQWTTAR